MSRRDNEMRKNHPLTRKLVEVREANGKAQSEVEKCMGIADQALGNIENGRQKLPHPIPGGSTSMSDFILVWLDCVDATPQQRKEVVTLMLRTILGDLPDV